MKYGAINVGYPTTMGYYVIKYLSETYALQEYQTADEKLSKAGELVFKEEYLSIMKEKNGIGKITENPECCNINMCHFSSINIGIIYKECY